MPRPRGSGCITCRIRRVRCDEAKPSCQRCLSTGRKCDGYMEATSNISRRDLTTYSQQGSLGNCVAIALPRAPTQVPAALLSHGNPQSREYQLFDIFRCNTVPSAASFIPSQFWSREVLQLAHSEPAVWHASISLAALHCRWRGISTDDMAKSEYPADECEKHYYRAVSLARDIHGPARALALSLMLGAAANMMGRLREGRMHIRAGRSMLSELGRTDQTESAADTLIRLDMEAMSLGDVTAPYEPEDAIVLRHEDYSPIESYEQATAGLFSMMRMLMLVDEVSTVSTHLATDEGFLSALRAWEAKMGTFETRRKDRDYTAALSIRFYHSLLRVMLVICIPGPETRFDAHLGLFERAIILAEGLSQRLENQTVTMESGLVMPLFLIGHKCRHPRIRRRAARLLKTLNRQEGLWRSDATAMFLQRVIEVEESNAVFSPDKMIMGNEESRTDMVQQVMAIPWEAWSEPDFKPPSWETWEGVDVVPETRRVLGFQPKVFFKERYLKALFYMSSGADIIAREETVWF